MCNIDPHLPREKKKQPGNRKNSLQCIATGERKTKFQTDL